jgi:hypothetical protein
MDLYFQWGTYEKRQNNGYEKHSPPSSAEVKEWKELYLHSPNTPSWRVAQLKKTHRNNFTSIFTESMCPENWNTLFHFCLIINIIREPYNLGSETPLEYQSISLKHYNLNSVLVFQTDA